MKQTAVEWLEQEFITLQNYGVNEIGLFENAKEMEKEQMVNTSTVTRVEVIQHSEPFNGRAYTNYRAKDVEIQFQDHGRTLKIFLK
jgi:hypothetical protein